LAWGGGGWGGSRLLVLRLEDDQEAERQTGGEEVLRERFIH